MFTEEKEEEEEEEERRKREIGVRGAREGSDPRWEIAAERLVCRRPYRLFEYLQFSLEKAFFSWCMSCNI